MSILLLLLNVDKKKKTISIIKTKHWTKIPDIGDQFIFICSLKWNYRFDFFPRTSYLFLLVYLSYQYDIAG